jgi:uncharacterized protein (DUF2252 family)
MTTDQASRQKDVSVVDGTPSSDPAARVAAGRSARTTVPFDAQVELPGVDDRPDPATLLMDQGSARLPELLPIRHGRMLSSPFAFFRGAAAIMAADLAGTRSSGLISQLCGDAHLSNFGAFASPERRLVFDINDFDETYPGPWEWDVKRLAASLAVAGRVNNFGRKERAGVVRATVGRYREAMNTFAGQRELDVFYAHADLDDLSALVEQQTNKTSRKRFAEAREKARTRDSMQAFRKLTALVDGNRRIVADPPLIVPAEDLMPATDRVELEEQIRELLAGYAETLPVDRRRLFGKFRFVDMARKVVGVGSVGTRCWIVLLTGRDPDDPLLLQVKEAPPSVLMPHVGSLAGTGWRSEGERVVSGQRLMQASSDVFLGWQSIAGIDGKTRDFYVRQLRDWKGSAIIETMDPAAMKVYGQLCGWTLARAHARTGDRIAIAAYLGDNDAFDRVMAEFAERYADRNDHDYGVVADAARAGRIPVQSGI